MRRAISQTSMDGSDADPVIPDVLNYYWALRTLCHAGCYRDAFLTDSRARPGTKVLMVPYGNTSQYPDRLLM